MHSNSKAVAVVLALFTLSACTPEGEKNLTNACDISGENYSIVGGSKLAPGNDLSATTVLIVDVPKDDPDSTSICTGTLLEDGFVLTAAHCKPRSDSTTAVLFSTSASCAVQDIQQTGRKVVNYKKHGSYSALSESSTYDLLLLKFEGDVPSGFYPRQLPTTDPAELSSQGLVMAGYGRTSEKSEDSGTLRFTTASNSRLSRNSVTYISKKHYGSQYRTESVPKSWALDQTQNNGVCSGDSGGPLYMRTATGLVLIGITSRGVDPNAYTKETARVCHGYTLFTDIYPHLDWIKENMERLR